MNKNLLLVSTHSEDKAFAAEVAIAAGLSLQSVTDPVEAARILAEEGAATVFVDASDEKQFDAFQSAIQSSVGLFSDRINVNVIHFITSDDIERVQYLIQSPLFGHFIMRNYGDPKEAGPHYARVVRATLGERAFGLSSLLKPGTRVQTVRLEKSTQKQDAVEAIRGYLVAAKFQTRMATVIANAVDELLMNAIFDAPVDAIGRPILTAASRASEIKLDGQHAVEMQVAFDGKYVAITATDLFGSLDKMKLLSHISKVYTEEEYKVRTSTAGAGIGLATVFRSGGSFFFVSESRTKTEVTVFFKRVDSYREFKDQFRFISTQFYF